MRANFAKFIFLSLSLIIIYSCGPSFKVGFDYDTEENFTVYRSYDFLKNPAGERERAFIIKRIKAAVKKELGNKGLNLLSDKPDLLVVIHTQIQDQINVLNWGYHYAPYVVYWGGYGYWGAAYRIDTYTYQKGSLIIDIVEAESKELIWRGVARGAVPEVPRSQQIEKVVNKAVNEILKNYPPPSK